MATSHITTGENAADQSNLNITNNTDINIPSRTIGHTLVGIPEFGGRKHENIKEFFSKIEQRAKIDQWTEKQTLSVLKYHLTGHAFNYLETEPKLNEPELSYAEFKQALLKKFGRRVIPGQGQINLSRCVQQPKETIDQYATRLKMTGNDLLKEDLGLVENNDPSGVAAMRRKHEKELIMQFQRGISQEVYKCVMMEISKNPKITFEEVVELAEQANNNLRLTRLQEGRVNYFERKGDDTRRLARREPQKSSSRTENWRQQNQQTTIKCYRCNQMGHIARFCSKNGPKNHLNEKGASNVSQSGAH